MIAMFLLGYDKDFSTFQERFESFLLELEKQRKTKVEEVSLCEWQQGVVCERYCVDVSTAVFRVTIQLLDTPQYRTATQYQQK